MCPCSNADGSSADTYRHCATYGCTSINASATNTNASSICEGVS